MKGGNSDPNKMTEQQLKHIYSFNLNNIGYGNNDGNGKGNLVNSTYGEILYSGVDKMIDEVRFNPNDVFYDLGSGNGRAVLQVYKNTPVKKAYGIEFYPERSYNSEKALKKFYKMYPSELDNDRLLSFQLQNIKDLHYLDDATVLYLASTCYPEELLGVVYDKVNGSPNIRCIVTQRQYDRFKDFLPNERTVILPCTWNNNVMWHFYSK